MAKKQITQLTIHSKYSELEKVKPFINKILTNVDEELINKIQLAVNEAVTNAFIHGNKKDQAKKIIINAKCGEDFVEITVKDEGEGFDPSSLADPTEKEQLLNQGGRGVFLIKKYTDETTFEKKGTLVRMTFYL